MLLNYAMLNKAKLNNVYNIMYTGKVYNYICKLILDAKR